MEILSCYMDESVDGINKIAYSVAVVVGTDAKWCRLEGQWQEVLTNNNIQYFRNADVYKRQQEAQPLCSIALVTA